MIKELTSLRFLFILAVFFHHALGINLYAGGGTMGVACFFVLGGFCTYLGYRERINLPSFHYKPYIISKAIKFYPVHWLCLLLVIPLTLSNGVTTESAAILGANAFLVHSWIPVYKVYFSYNAVSWYLANTIFFAAIFPYLYKFLSNGRIKFWLIGLLALFYLLCCIFIPAQYRHALLYINPIVRLCDFVVGILIGMLYVTLKDKESIKIYFGRMKWLSHAIIVIVMVALVAMSIVIPFEVQYIAAVYWIPIAFLLIVISISSNWGGHLLLSINTLQYLGKCSFAFYMIHYIVLKYQGIILRKLGCNDLTIHVIVGLIVSICLSILIYNYFEQPVSKWLKRKIQPFMTVRS